MQLLQKLSIFFLLQALLFTPIAFAQNPDNCDPYSNYDCLLDRVEQVIGNWSAAWVNHDIDAYFDVYAAASSPKSEYTYEQWRQKRISRLSLNKNITLDIKVLEVKPLSNQSVGVQFFQRYSADNYSDNVIKQLILNSDFKIVQELIVAKMSDAEVEEMMQWLNTGEN